MEFLLGVFTGATLMIFLGAYLREKDKKEKQAANEKAMRDLNSFLGWLRGDAPKAGKALSEQLKDAITRDDFEEAARLRDLMKKK